MTTNTKRISRYLGGRSKVTAATSNNTPAPRPPAAIRPSAPPQRDLGQISVDHGFDRSRTIFGNENPFNRPSQQQPRGVVGARGAAGTSVRDRSASFFGFTPASLNNTLKSVQGVNADQVEAGEETPAGQDWGLTPKSSWTKK